MLLTEAEAKGKQCPMTFNNPAATSAGSFQCIGSSCMAWRWERRTFCLIKSRFLEHGESTTEGNYEMRPT